MMPCTEPGPAAIATVASLFLLLAQKQKERFQRPWSVKRLDAVATRLCREHVDEAAAQLTEWVEDVFAGKYDEEYGCAADPQRGACILCHALFFVLARCRTNRPAWGRVMKPGLEGLALQLHRARDRADRELTDWLTQFLLTWVALLRILAVDADRSGDPALGDWLVHFIPSLPDEQARRVIDLLLPKPKA